MGTGPCGPPRGPPTALVVGVGRKLCMGSFAYVVPRMVPKAPMVPVVPRGSLAVAPCVAPARPPISLVGRAIYGTDFLRETVASRCPADLLRQNYFRSLH